jgi:hypothetical protein
LDRVSKACLELTRVCDEKYGFCVEAREAQAARRARERAAQGTCLICLDDKPNIATLCCGKATHLNCIAEWLSMSHNSSCPVCRSTLPPVTQRVSVIRRDNNNNHNHVNQDTESTIDVTESTIDVDIDNDDGQDQDESNESERILVRVFENVFDTTEEDTTTTQQEDAIDNENNNNNNHTNAAAAAAMESTEDTTSTVETTDDTSTTTSGRRQEAPHPDPDTDDTTTTTEDDTTTLDAAAPAAPPPQVLYCNALYCHNRPAVDCSNSLCGRCCVLGGEYRCSRHNS